MVDFKELRARTGMRSGQFAKVAGVSHSTLWRVEHTGKNSVSPEFAYRIVNALNRALGTSYGLDDFDEPSSSKSK